MKPYRYNVEVRFRDTDNLGHINNAVYLTYSENCRTHFLQDVLGLDVFKTGQRISIILARAEIDFLAQGFLHHKIYVEAVTERVGTKSFTQAYTIRTEGQILAKSRAVLVWYDFDKDSSVPVPDEVRAKLASFLPGEEAP